MKNNPFYFLIFPQKSDILKYGKGNLGIVKRKLYEIYAL